MLDVRELGQLYNDSYFGVMPDRYVWKEHQSNPTALAQVEFRFKGGCIGYIKSNLLDETKDVYNQQATPTLNLRKICDGVLFLEREGYHYIAILEMKSNFHDVRKKAVVQIPSSYVKLKSILNDFVGYRRDDFKEFGLIVSYPHIDAPVTSSYNNPSVLEQKRIMTGNHLEAVKDKYSNRLKKGQKADFLGSDFEFQQLNAVKKDLFFDKLPVRHHPVANHCVSAVVDLDPIVASL